VERQRRRFANQCFAKENLMQVSVFRTSWVRLGSALAILTAATVALAATSQGNGCPDSGIKEVPSTIKYGGWKTCGTGLQITTGGLTVNSRQSRCPIFAVYEPLHHIPTLKVGFKTVPGALLPITLFSFKCADRWLLGLIPIGSECEITGSKTAGTIQNYVELACSGRNQRESGSNGGRGKLGGR
jgi:hypothetical protein